MEIFDTFLIQKLVFK